MFSKLLCLFPTPRRRRSHKRSYEILSNVKYMPNCKVFAIGNETFFRISNLVTSMFFTNKRNFTSSLQICKHDTFKYWQTVYFCKQRSSKSTLLSPTLHILLNILCNSPINLDTLDPYNVLETGGAHYDYEQPLKSRDAIFQSKQHTHSFGLQLEISTDHEFVKRKTGTLTCTIDAQLHVSVKESK